VLIDTPIRSLGHVDTARLAARVMATEESVWRADNRRQDEYEVHAETQSIILVFFTGWPEVHVSHAAGWDGFNDVAMPVIDTIIAKNYRPGGLILRAVLARLQPNCRIDNHIDIHPSFSIAHRIHVPLVTNPNVEFIVGGEPIATRPGHAFELNNKMAHSVANRGDCSRVHLIFDYAPE
jgi:Aspartyl/Asparaginyl beta-hydroxylase